LHVIASGYYVARVHNSNKPLYVAICTVSGHGKMHTSTWGDQLEFINSNISV